jgi:transposase-like protein
LEVASGIDMTMPGSYAPPPPLLGNPRSGIKYRSYTDEDMNAAVRAIAEEGMSLRKASIKYNVPKTTLAERLGGKRPRLPSRKSSETKPSVTRYTWSEADMEKALTALHQGTVPSISEAARQFGVPASSLNARKRGRTPRNLKGELSRLTLQQESLLADWASAQAALGFPANKDEVFSLAERALQKQGVDRRLGKQWLQHWMRRYPNIEILDWKKPERPQKMDKPVDDDDFSSGIFQIIGAPVAQPPT